MTQQTIIDQINKLVHQLRFVKLLQFLSDCFFIYLTYVILVSGELIAIFGREFNQTNALIIVVLVAVINFCLSMLVRNVKLSGRNLAEQLDAQLVAQEESKIKQFY